MIFEVFSFSLEVGRYHDRKEYQSNIYCGLYKSERILSPRSNWEFELKSLTTQHAKHLFSIHGLG